MTKKDLHFSLITALDTSKQFCLSVKDRPSILKNNNEIIKNLIESEKQSIDFDKMSTFEKNLYEKVLLKEKIESNGM